MSKKFPSYTYNALGDLIKQPSKFCGTSNVYCNMEQSGESAPHHHHHHYCTLPATRERLAGLIGNSRKLRQIGCLCLMRRGNNSSGQFMRCHHSEENRHREVLESIDPARLEPHTWPTILSIHHFSQLHLQAKCPNPEDIACPISLTLSHLLLFFFSSQNDTFKL